MAHAPGWIELRIPACCPPIRGERADEVIAALELAVSRFGVPLVIKWDNGSGFIAAEVRASCQVRGITLLHSPPRLPSYNGGCEVRNRWAKVSIRRAAATAGRPGRPQHVDLDAACTWSGQPSIVDATTRAGFLATFANELTAVCAARGVADLEREADHVRRSLERVAARRALELCHILMIRGREYRW